MVGAQATLVAPAGMGRAPISSLPGNVSHFSGQGNLLSHSGRNQALFILRMKMISATLSLSARGLFAEQRGARRGDGHEHDGHHGAYSEPFAQHDESSERGHSRL
jgi:hypothetical protein